VRTGTAVVVPARDEEDGIRATVHHVLASLDVARRDGLVDATTVEVVAHRCTDRTAVRAAAALLDRHDGHVTRDHTSVTVGQVRDGGARRALRRLDTCASATWVLSTDADTLVGPDWVAGLLTAARAASAEAVVGITTLDRWRGTERAAVAYERLLRDKTCPDASPGLHQHDHVYGANLGVRADAYLAVGGFPHVGHGEDQALVDALAARGHRLLRTTAVTVVTSGRLHGRATGGLADHLARLDCPAGQDLSAVAGDARP
jgi:hypothetical protein